MCRVGCLSYWVVRSPGCDDRAMLPPAPEGCVMIWEVDDPVPLCRILLKQVDEVLIAA